MALKWFLEGALPLILVMAACRLRGLWLATRARVMKYPGPYAFATYWVLQFIRWAAVVGVVMLAAVTLGWGGAAATVLAIVLILQVVALCSVGLMLPMLAVVPGRRRNSAQPG